MPLEEVFKLVLSNLHLLYLSLNNVLDFGRKKFECLTVLVLSFTNLYALYIHIRTMSVGRLVFT